MYSCHSVLECYDLLSGVKLSIRSFLFYPFQISDAAVHLNNTLITGYSF